MNHGPAKGNGPLVGSDPIQESTSPKQASGMNFTQFLPSEKAFLTVQAKFARAGHTLHAATDENGITRWTVGKWGWTRTYADWADVAEFLARVEGGAQ